LTVVPLAVTLFVDPSMSTHEGWVTADSLYPAQRHKPLSGALTDIAIVPVIGGVPHLWCGFRPRLADRLAIRSSIAAQRPGSVWWSHSSSMTTSARSSGSCASRVGSRS
jgi:hypothetical protein